MDGIGSGIGGMEDLDAPAACEAIAANRMSLLEAEAQMLGLAAHWADLHNGDALDHRGRVLPGMESAKRLGAPGTPRVREFAASELAGLQGISIVSASNLMADALNIRHRHPLLWAAVHAHQVRVWQARRIARDCAAAGLSAEQARWVDAATTGYVESLPWGRFERLLAAKIIEAAPDAAEARRKAAEAEQFVALGACNELGLRTVIAKATAGDAVYFVAVIDRIATALAAFGDTRPIGQRRAAALGIIANPVRTVRLLADYQHHLDTTTTDGDGDEKPDGDSRDGEDNGGDNSSSEEAVAEGEELALIGEADLHPADNDADDPDPDPCPSCGSTGGPGSTDRSGAAPMRGNPTAFVRQATALGLLEVDWRRLLPTVTFYCHLSQTNLTAEATGVARIEGLAPVTIDQLREFLRDTTTGTSDNPGTAASDAAGRCHVGRIDLKGVIDPAGQTPVDAYETPDPMREALQLRHPGEVFPFSPYLGRRVDLDHTTPYRPPHNGGPPGQTHPDNLAPLRRLPHRLKTHGRWRIRSAGNGIHLWRSEHGWYYQVDATGTHRLTHQAGHAWWHTLEHADAPERTIHLTPGPPITHDPGHHTADAN